jgi:hypothetical protein
MGAIFGAHRSVANDPKGTLGSRPDQAADQTSCFVGLNTISVYVDVARLADREGHCPRERAGRNRCGGIELLDARSRRAVASPNPELAPVITTTFPVMLLFMTDLSICLDICEFDS